MKKDYILIIEGKKGKEYFECKNMKEVETRLFERSYKIFDFEIYKTVEIEEVAKLIKFAMQRIRESK